MTDLSAFYVVEPDIPAGMTIAAYRHSRCRRLSRWRRLVLRARVGAAVA
jgi:hypothetical protein